MKYSKLIKDYWDKFCSINSGVELNEDYQVWHFGDDRGLANELYELVLQGKKKATASLVWENENNPENAPILNGYSVITDFDGNPKCIIKTTEIEIKRFNEVDEQFAADEGEGDLSLSYWREVHWKYFARKCNELGKEANDAMLVVCERFKLVFPTNAEGT